MISLLIRLLLALQSAISPSASGNAQAYTGLTEREQLLVQRLLSDPTYFPIEFKRWLKDYLEGQDMTVLANNVQPAITTKWGDESGLPIGTIFYASTGGYPSDCTLCDGGMLGVDAYKKLFDKIGYSYGGSGSTFATPAIAPLSGFFGPDIPAVIVKGRNV